MLVPFPQEMPTREAFAILQDAYFNHTVDRRQAALVAWNVAGYGLDKFVPTMTTFGDGRQENAGEPTEAEAQNAFGAVLGMRGDAEVELDPVTLMILVRVAAFVLKRFFK